MHILANCSYFWQMESSTFNLFKWRHWKWFTRTENGKAVNNLPCRLIPSSVTEFFCSTISRNIKYSHYKVGLSDGATQGLASLHPAEIVFPFLLYSSSLSLWWHVHSHSTSSIYSFGTTSRAEILQTLENLENPPRSPQQVATFPSGAPLHHMLPNKLLASHSLDSGFNQCNHLLDKNSVFLLLAGGGRGEVPDQLWLTSSTNPYFSPLH